MKYLLSFLEKLCTEKTGRFDKSVYESFQLYYELLTAENEKYNLTTITDREAVEKNHFLDSLTLDPYIRESVLDVGAGAGFPSLPLAIVNRDKRFTLIESVGKKTGFLEKVKDALKLDNVTVLNIRIEDFIEKEAFDTAVARAVAPMRVLLEYTIPFLKVGGTLAALKGSDFENEKKDAANALKELNAEIIKEEVYSVAESVSGKRIVIVRKLNKTDVKYPRKQNKPRKSPL